MENLVYILPAIMLIGFVCIAAAILGKLLELVLDISSTLHNWQEQSMKKCPALWNDDDEEDS